jgi:hypothetical protein
VIPSISSVLLSGAQHIEHFCIAIAAFYSCSLSVFGKGNLGYGVYLGFVVRLGRYWGGEMGKWNGVFDVMDTRVC